MAKKRVFLFPGFGASDLGIFSTGQIVWWDPSIAMVLNIGTMRLAADGKSPGPPDGVQMGVTLEPQNPWGPIRNGLNAQLGIDQWKVDVVPYDWRLSLIDTGKEISDSIAANTTPENPATLVGHSMGGLACVFAYYNLALAGKANLVRRVITICSPFQGTYLPIMFVNGTSETVRQLAAIGQLAAVVPVLDPLKWKVNFLNGVALTWPSFYEVWPALWGGEAANDPNRINLYTSSKFPPSVSPSQPWLDHSRNVFQQRIQQAIASLPYHVATSFAATGLDTPIRLNSDRLPIPLARLGMTKDGDGLCSAETSTLPLAVTYKAIGDHATVPLWMMNVGRLAEAVRDERRPPPPPPPPPRPPLVIGTAFAAMVTDPPEAEDVSPILCIGGG